MELTLFQVDAFSDRLFGGNPAAVVPLKLWLEDHILQQIATENNLSETAFFVKEQAGYRLRWFTPVCEVDLCGHATLAASHVLFSQLGFAEDELLFYTRSGELRVRRGDDGYGMNFPLQPAVPCEAPEPLLKGLGAAPKEVLAGPDYLCIYESEADILALQPEMEHFRKLLLRGVIVSAPGVSVDFVSRFFAPSKGVPEDPVTGSAHCTLMPYWANRLGKRVCKARQVSRRGGDIRCEMQGDRVVLWGKARLYLKGTIFTA